jgi:hypothetical protein
LIDTKILAARKYLFHKKLPRDTKEKIARTSNFRKQKATMWRFPISPCEGKTGTRDAPKINEPPLRSFEEAVRDIPLVPHVQLPGKLKACDSGKGTVTERTVYSSFGSSWNDGSKSHEHSSGEEKKGEAVLIQVPKYAMVVVDGLCPHNSGYLSNRIREVYGETVIQALSCDMAKRLYEKQNSTAHLECRLPRGEDELKAWLASLENEANHYGHSPFHILGVYCESDLGLDETEVFAELLSKHHQPMLKHNKYNKAKRHLFDMNESLRGAGLATVRQCLCATYEEAEEFCRTDLGLPDAIHVSKDSISPSCVVRSTCASGSHTVPKCDTLEDVKQVFASLPLGEKRVVQELASGVEHVVDLVSHEGEHKVAAVWRCDKRNVYASPFSIYATHLAHPHDSVEAKMACEYAMAALDALDVKWGPTHANIMVDHNVDAEDNQDSKHCCKLIDLKCRQHNIDSTVLTSKCIGYTALGMLLVSYMGDIPGLVPRLAVQKDCGMIEWDDLPVYPKTENIRGYGAVIHLVSNTKGSILEGCHRTDIIEIPSVQMVCVNNFGDPRSSHYHVNKRDDAGCIYMMHEDPMQFQKDYIRVLELLPDFIMVK